MCLLQVDSWEGLQGFLQHFAGLKPGPVARSAMHHVLSQVGAHGGPSGGWGVDREVMSHAVGLPPHATGLPHELEVFLEQAIAVASPLPRSPSLCQIGPWPPSLLASIAAA